MDSNESVDLSNKRYVIVYAKPVNTFHPGVVLVVLKNRPAWQAGRFNLVGGHIEEGETPEQCAVRELKEEAGLDPAASPVRMGKIIGDGVVYAVKVPVFYDTPQPRPGETEVVAWMDWLELKESPRLMPNLKVIVPMMIHGVTNWVVEDYAPSWKKKEHTFKVTVPADDDERKI